VGTDESTAPPAPAARPPVLAAGGVPMRQLDGRTQLLLVHRPRHDDWTLPKGHIEPGEHPLVAAAREVTEETGLAVRLGPPLPALAYPLPDDRTKLVRFWAAVPLEGQPDSPTPVDLAEVDRVEWVDAADAYDALTYEDDRQIVDAALRTIADGQPPVPVIVLRHAHAKNRNRWPGPDELRPLATRGHQEAVRLAAILTAYGPDRVVSSDSLRCRQTVQPFAAAANVAIDEDHRLSEDTTPRKIRRVVAEAVTSALESGRAVVVCTHRPMMPDVFATLEIPVMSLTPGSFVVAHLGRDRSVHAVEHHDL
jgi:phosphohistidine phosphatase SixA/8-oxo-dGTP pyrophosphatase MutT (NUDIX family)